MAGTILLNFLAPHTYQRKFRTSDVDLMLEASHHYVVTRGPRVRVERTQVRASGAARFWLSASTMREIYPFDLDFGAPNIEVQVTHGGQYWVIRSNGHIIAHGSAWALAAATSQRFDALSNHEVIYIGKALGNPSRPRSSTDRLAAHSTLQRIYEDHSAEDSVDIFVTPLLLEEVDFLATSYIDDDEADLSLDRALPFMRKDSAEPNRVGLAEEALIAYFKPAYNIQLNEWGSSLTKPARAAMSAGFRAVVVTVSGWYGLARFASAQVDPELVHMAVFILGRQGPAPTESNGQGVGSLFVPQNWLPSLIADVERSPVQIGVFGDALPPTAPWGMTVPDERLM